MADTNPKIKPSYVPKLNPHADPLKQQQPCSVELAMRLYKMERWPDGQS